MSVGLAACAAPSQGAPASDGSAYSSPGSSSFSGGTSVSTGSHAPSAARTVRGVETASNVLVKPDSVNVCFTLRTSGSDAPKALEDFRGVIGDMERRFKETVARDATVRMLGVAVSPDSGASKKEEATKGKALSVVATGIVEIALPESASYWERARIVGAAAQLAASFSAAHEAPVRAIVTAPEVLVKAPEKHRQTLLDKWVAKSRELSKTAKIGERTLDFTSCSPPGDVQQRALSLEEAELTLAVSCEPLRGALEKP
jgi:hypothetical protein